MSEVASDLPVGIPIEIIRRCRACLIRVSRRSTAAPTFKDLLAPIRGRPQTANVSFHPTYLQCFNECTQLQVTAHDYGEHHWEFVMCHVCAKELIKAYDFLTKARKSDEELRHESMVLQLRSQVDESRLFDAFDRVEQNYSSDDAEAFEPIEEVQFSTVEKLEKVQTGNQHTVWDTTSYEAERELEKSKTEYFTEIGSNSDFCIVKDEEERSELESIDEEDSAEDSSTEYTESNSTLCRRDLEVLVNKGANLKSGSYISDIDTMSEISTIELESRISSDDIALEDETIDYKVEFLKNDHENSETTPDQNGRGDDDEEEEGKGKDAESIFVKLVDNESDDSSSCERQDKFFQFNCELCTEQFDLQSKLLDHYAQDHDSSNLQFPCDLCENRFINKSVLGIHIRKVHNRCPYIDCEKCGRTVLKSCYSRHLKHHQMRVQYPCIYCPNSYTSKYSLQKHLLVHINKRKRNIECQDCGRKFFSKENLELHRTVHVNPNERNNFSCTLCQKTFKRISNLKLHMQMHRGATIECRYCDKKFVRRVDLQVHTRFHTRTFPFECKFCGKRFAIKGHLTYHEKRHLGWRYKCNQCGKQFLNMSGLKEHSYGHTSMPFLCNICMKGFPTKFKMRRHLSSVHLYLFEVDGYSDALADKFITHKDAKILQNCEVLIQASNDENVIIESVEMLDEHKDDITTDMLVM